MLNELNPLDPTGNGVRIYDVSLAGSYFSGSAPPGVIQGVPLANSGNSYIGVMQVSTSLGWRRSEKDRSFGVLYAPSYARAFYSSNFHSFNQQMSLVASSKIGNKWTVGLTVQGIAMDFSEHLLTPSVGGSTDVQTGSGTMVIGTGLVGSPPDSFAYGNSELSAAGNITLAYAYSTRSTFQISFGANRTQFFSTGGGAFPSNLSIEVPRTTAITGSLGWSYSVTPRTDVTVSLSSSRTVSRFQDAYSPTATIGLGRKLTPSWRVSGAVGLGEIVSVYSKYLAPRNVQWVYNGALTYKLDSHFLSVSYARSLSDVYGLGASATESENASWVWRRAGDTVSLRAAFGYSRLVGSVFHGSGSWTAQTSFSKSIGSHLFSSFSYNYVSFPNALVEAASHLSQNGAVVAISWSPVLRQ